MRQVHIPLQRVAAAGVLLAAMAGLSASAQQATTTPAPAPSTATSTTTIRVPRTTATPAMIDEAVRRSKARHQRFLATGTPEQWGSEEPFTK